MRYLKYLLVSLCSALFTAYAMLLLSAPSPLEATTMPPLTVKQDGNELLVGGWKTVEGYEQPGMRAVEIWCSRQQNSCTESQDNLLQHDAGPDLEAQVFEYRIKSWSADRVEAIASVAMGQWLNRTLSIQVAENAATLNWAPDKSCDGDSGQAVLVGNSI